MSAVCHLSGPDSWHVCWSHTDVEETHQNTINIIIDQNLITTGNNKRGHAIIAMRIIPTPMGSKDPSITPLVCAAS